MGDVTPASPGPERSGSLALPARSTPRRGRRLAAYAGVGVVVLAVLAWFATHPSALDTSTHRIQASTPAGEPVYVGVFVAPGDFGRTLHVNGVRVFADSSVKTQIVPHVCRGGSVSVTTDPVSFCSAVLPTEGATLGPGDEIMLEVTGDAAGVAVIDRVRLAYRDGVQWAVQDAGAPSQVTFLPR
jgi:hypothetical protein